MLAGEHRAPVRVVLLDDETVSRAGLTSILGADSNIAVIAAVGTHAEAIRMASRDDAEVVVASVEYWRAGFDAGAISALIAAVQAPVIFVGANPDALGVRSARAAGAAGLISKRASASAIRGAVHSAASGANVFPRPSGSLSRPPSGREQQVITGVAGGQTNDEIAWALGLSARTIASHLRRCFIRYGVSSRTELAMLAVQERWFTDNVAPLSAPSAGAA